MLLAEVGVDGVVLEALTRELLFDDDRFLRVVGLGCHRRGRCGSLEEREEQDDEQCGHRGTRTVKRGHSTRSSVGVLVFLVVSPGVGRHVQDQLCHPPNGYNSHMKRASVSQAKNGLSALLDRVRHGHTIIIEDRGVPVARLEPVIGSTEADGRQARLERQGLVRRAAKRLSDDWLDRRPPRLLKGRKASDVVLAERREGR